jgi:tetratricopeptide (TPR) repeat protein
MYGLARRCADEYPDLVARLLPVADKFVKATGDLYFVWQVARLSYRASLSAASGTLHATPQMLTHRAQTLICGLSWVNQRMGRLEKAMDEAQQSLRIGEDLGWARNTAFCHKCLGRLYRMMAEDAIDEAERARLLRSSQENLSLAFEEFSASKEHDLGPSCADVGECHSLLGRTRLAQRDLKSARRSVNQAYDILEPDHIRSKEYADLLILDGDLAAIEGESQRALSLFNEALRLLSDGSTNEIRARALVSRGNLLVGLGQRDRAAEDFLAASGIYAAMRDPRRSAQCRLASIKLNQPIDPVLEQALQGAEPEVWVEAIRIVSQRFQVNQVGAIARRSGISRPVAEQIIKEARILVRMDQVEWD